MMKIIKRIFHASWVHYLARLRHVWNSCLAYVFRRGYPSPFNLRPLTEQQLEFATNEFVESIDTDAIRTLATKYTGGLPCSIRCRQQGSFNVCFVLDFPDDIARVVRLPIEPAVHNAWDKNSPEDCRRQFFGDIIDIFAQLRRLEFSQGGSLMPNATVGTWPQLLRSILRREEAFIPQSATDHGFGPRLVGAISMRKNELQIDGYTASRSVSTTVNEYFREQYQLLECIWKMPAQELSREKAQRDEFALYALSLEEAQNIAGLKTGLSGDSFHLSHPDLRVDNIIVDDKLRICGIIDWEFSVTVPRYAFLPPSWLTGYDTTSMISKLDFSSEFMSVLSSKKHRSYSHAQLAQDWSFQDHLRLPMAYIFLDPSDLIWLFYQHIYPRLYKKPYNEVVPLFFQLPENKDLQVGLERRLYASKRYTQYLKDHNLADDEAPEMQQLRQWTLETQKTLEQLSKWSDETQGKLARLERERAMYCEQGKQV
ncbi:hypothetical protein F66182_7547 [Fusarium sp. NRRL 66182]|nr:hypothetical protein F66182_7547 [Fusarium sp. NRRL 66182]